MKKYFCHLSLLIALLVLIGCNPPVESGRNDQTGLDPDRIGQIDSVINEAIASGELHGAVGLVACNGNIEYHKSFGYADKEAGVEMEVQSIFRIASMSKAITTAGVMILYERGHFMLNDPVSAYIPEFKNPEVLIKADEEGIIIETRPASREIRIIDLLTHSSGISYPFSNTPLKKTYVKNGIIDAMTSQPYLLEEKMKLLAGLPLLFDPGSSYAYGLNTDVLGYLCEVISGKPLNRFFKDEIFKPLGMEDTYFYLPEEKAERLVTLYAWSEEGLKVSDGTESSIILDNPDYPVEGAMTYFSGGGGLSSTALDYGRFIQMLLNEGELEGTRILSRKSVELMRSARVDTNNDDITDFGLGFSVVSDIGKVGELSTVGTFAWGGAFNTSYWIDPEEKMIAVFMSQQRPARGRVNSKFLTAVYQALK